jgi:hypothetical protein
VSISSEPRRWTEGDAPTGAADLLRCGQAPPPMPTEVWIQSAEAIAERGRVVSKKRDVRLDFALVGSAFCLTLFVSYLALGDAARSFFFDGESRGDEEVTLESAKGIEPLARSFQVTNPAIELAASKGNQSSSSVEVGVTERGSSIVEIALQGVAWEATLLERARVEVNRDPSSTLRLLEVLGVEFPNGNLLEEREYLTISALLSSGRRREATKRAGVFLKRFPESPYLKRIRQAIER